MKKFRPYFTLPELEVISSALKSSQSPQIGLIRYVDKFISDIQNGYRKENHTLKPSLEESLGFSKPSETSYVSIEYLMEVYEKTGFQSMTPGQILKIQLHRYENDLMSSEEETAFEQSQIGK